ncbi:MULTISPECIES: hypothetical protein [unclassified Methylobacterium]|uniref:hypothetical protein n=1 Tax=unclassified Methylobacterium TaxID=2615210 RepID=UPI0032AEC17C
MILAIIAFAAPSTVLAHDGHAHHGHHVAAAQPKVVPASTSAIPPMSFTPGAKAEALAWSTAALPIADVEFARIYADQDGGDFPGPCKTRCCGPMACCVTGIVSGPYALSPSFFRTITLIPDDVFGRAGAGPEALPEPPRTLA